VNYYGANCARAVPSDTTAPAHPDHCFCDTCQARKAKAPQPAPTKGTNPLDTQEGGDHYKKMGIYQPWQVNHAWMSPEELKGHMKGTVNAYLAREADKGGRLDIKKAHHTLGIYLELTKDEDNT
jgi:hypothetical protein